MYKQGPAASFGIRHSNTTRILTGKTNSMKPKIVISKDNLTKVAHAMNGFLADEFLLYLKTRNALWNIDGSDFHAT